LLEDTETSSIRAQNVLSERLEAKISSLAAELDMEARCNTELTRQSAQKERKLNETKSQYEELLKKSDKMQVYKTQLLKF